MGGEGEIQNSATCQGGRAEQGLAPVLCACDACLPLPMRGGGVLAGVECHEGLVGDSTASRGPLGGPCFVSSGKWLAAGVLLCQTGTRIPIPWGGPGDSTRPSTRRSVGNRNSDCWRRALLRTQKKPHGGQKAQWYRLGLWEKGAECGFEVGGHLSQEAAASATLGGLGRDRMGL